MPKKRNNKNLKNKIKTPKKNQIMKNKKINLKMIKMKNKNRMKCYKKMMILNNNKMKKMMINKQKILRKKKNKNKNNRNLNNNSNRLYNRD